MEWFILFVTLTFLMFIAQNSYKSGRLLSFYISYSIIVLFIGFRYNVGTDFEGYQEIYKIYKEKGIWDKEIGFRYILFFSNKLGIETYGMLAISAAITYYFVFITIYRKSYYFVTSIVALFGSQFVAFSTNGVRQAIAISICFYAIEFLCKGQKFKYIISIIFASFFHITALFMIPFYLFLRLKPSIYLYSLLLITAIYLYIFSLNSFFVKDFIVLIAEVSGYERYIDRIFAQSEFKISLVVISQILIATMIVVFGSNWLKTDDKEFIIYVNYFFFGIILSVAFSNIFLFNRISHYFILSAVLFIPKATSKFSTQSQQLCFKIAAILYYSFIFFYVYLIDGRGQLRPFDSIFFN